MISCQRQAASKDLLRVYTPEELVALAHPPLFAPGTDRSNSSTGYILLGLVVEKAPV